MKTPQKEKRGPKTAFVRDHENKHVNGLRIQKTKDASGNPFERYYAVVEENAKSTRKLFGSSKDKPAAIEAYRRWLLKRNRETVSIGSRLDDVERYIKDEIDAGKDDIELTVDLDGETYNDSEVPASAFWDLVAKYIRESPKLVAQKTGIEQIGYLDKVAAPKPSPKLDTLGDEYLNRAKIMDSEAKNAKKWWKEFCKIVDAKTVKELDYHQFRKYSDQIKADQLEPSKHTKKPKKNSYVISRIAAVQKILNHAGEYRLIDANEWKRIEDEWREPLVKPSQDAAPPKALKSDEFVKLYDAAETIRDRCILLLGLNCAYYPIDLTRLLWKHIRFDIGALDFRRMKVDRKGRVKGVFRVAALWNKTTEQLDALQKEYELNGIEIDDDSHVFLLTGKNTFTEIFKAIKKRTTIRQSLTLCNLRDSVATRGAVLGWTQQYKMIIGHQIDSVSDNKYVEREVENVRPLCNAVAEYYGFK